MEFFPRMETVFQSVTGNIGIKKQKNIGEKKQKFWCKKFFISREKTNIM